MNIIDDQNLCTGCGACYYSCPKKCISMSENKEGFLFPEINDKICVNCGKCRKVCPSNNQTEKSEFIGRCYAAWNLNESVRMDSSSGGLFTSIAEEILAENGVIYAAKMENDFDLHHIRITDSEHLAETRKSKYYQSRVFDVFDSIKADISSDRKVMFIGTPCQVAAVKRLFDCDNLFTVDLVCHGVASKKIVLNYVKSLAKKYGAEVKRLIFRHKNIKRGG